MSSQFVQVERERETARAELLNYRKYLEGRTVFCDSDASVTARYAEVLRELSFGVLLTREDAEQWDFDELIAHADVFILTPDDGRYQAFLRKVVEADKGFIIVGQLNTAMYKELTAMLHKPLMVGANTFALL